MLSLNPYDQSQYAQAYNYMRANSKGEVFTDVSNEDKITTQPFFTATKAQYTNSDYNPNLSQGLVDQSLFMLPAGKGLQESSKVVVEGGSKAITLVNTYDKELSWTGLGVTAEMSYQNNAPKYSGLELAEHIGVDVTIAYLTNKFTPDAQGWKMVLYGATGGGIGSGFGEISNQGIDMVNHRTQNIQWSDVMMNGLLDGTGGGLGKTFKWIGTTLKAPEGITNSIDLAISNGFKPTVQPFIDTLK